MLFAILLFSGSSLFASGRITARDLPSKDAVLAKMSVANTYFMLKWPDTGKSIITNRERPSNIWTRGVYYEGLMAMYRIRPEPKLLDYAIAWGEAHKWGLRDGVRTRNADNQCCGQTYLELYRMDPKPERLRDIKTSVDRMLESEKIDDWNWIDALQMAMPVFAQLAVITGDNSYYERMYSMYNHTKTVEGGIGLFNPKDNLWWRDKDFLPPYVEPNGEDCYWSRGNGWVVAALVRVLEILPANAPYRKEYLSMFKKMAKALLPLQREDGFWNVSLHDPNHFGGKEATGTALFVYGMAWGINQGILPARTYLPAVVKGWHALANESVTASGFLGYVQGTGKEPKDGQPVTVSSLPDFEDYGLGCFLLAGTEVWKMTQH